MHLLYVHFDITSYWHPGTGKGQGPGADAEANRTKNGLPYLPGRTIKGLLLDGAIQAGVSDADRSWCFGTALIQDEGQIEEARFRTEPGALRFDSARIGKDEASILQWENWAGQIELDEHGKPRQKNADKISQLFRIFSSTKLKDGVAVDHTLRSIEVVVPVHLCAPIRVAAAEKARAANILRAAAPFVNVLGAHRTRGLGRCITTLQEPS